MALTDGERDILRELNEDAYPSLTEQVADWAGCAAEDVTEDDIMRFEDTMRDEAAEGWGTP